MGTANSNSKVRISVKSKALILRACMIHVSRADGAADEETRIRTQ